MNYEAREIVEIIMTQHWDMKSCDCWVCTKGRESGLHPRPRYLGNMWKRPLVAVEDE